MSADVSNAHSPKDISGSSQREAARAARKVFDRQKMTIGLFVKEMTIQLFHGHLTFSRPKLHLSCWHWIGLGLREGGWARQELVTFANGNTVFIPQLTLAVEDHLVFLPLEGAKPLNSNTHQISYFCQTQLWHIWHDFCNKYWCFSFCNKSTHNCQKIGLTIPAFPFLCGWCTESYELIKNWRSWLETA